MSFLNKHKTEAAVNTAPAADGLTGTAEDVDAVMKKYDRESNVRVWEGKPKTVIRFLMAAFSLFCIYLTLVDKSLPEVRLSLFLAMIIVIGFLNYPIKKGHVRVNHIPWYDVVLMVAGAGPFLYFAANAQKILLTSYSVISKDLFMLALAIMAILVLVELCRRCVGLPILFVVGALLIYTFANVRFGKVIYDLFYTTNGVMNTPINVCQKYIVVFIIFGAFLERTSISAFFIDLANCVAGSSCGGPAKVAVISSALCGMVSGSSVGNTVTTGSVTIPMMIKTGYSPRFSAAVESVASTGGQMTPPILGAAAFIIAELTGTPYLDIALATVIPALLYFTSIYYMIDLEALKLSLMGHKAEDLPNVRSLIVRRGHLLIPILVLLYVMIVMKASVVKAAIFGIYATVLCTFLRRDTRITVNKAVAGIADGAKQAVGLISACATAGLIIGVLNMTGTGLKFAGAVIAFSGGSIPVALFLTMCASLVLGMGLPTAAAYLICAAVVAPALTGLGVPVLTANLFIFYFACLSAITPPVALAAFTASFLARSNPMSVAFTAVRLGFVAFIVPYMFVYAPSLLFQGSPLTIATTIVTALAGVVFIGSALQGYFLGARLPAASRVLFFAAAITLIIPGYLTDGIGAGLGLFGYAVQRCMAKRGPQTQTC